MPRISPSNRYEELILNEFSEMISRGTLVGYLTMHGASFIVEHNDRIISGWDRETYDIYYVNHDDVDNNTTSDPCNSWCLCTVNFTDSRDTWHYIGTCIAFALQLVDRLHATEISDERLAKKVAKFESLNTDYQEILHALQRMITVYEDNLLSKENTIDLEEL